MEKINIPKRIVCVTLIAAFALAFLICGISAAVKRSAAEKERRKNETVVLKIGDNAILRDEFTFFCVTTIESDFEALRTNGSVLNKLNDDVKETTVRYLEEFYAVLTSAKDAGITLSENEKKEIAKAADALGNDDFFFENYNVSKDKYIKIKENFSLCEKFYGKALSVLSEEEKTQLLKENYMRLFTARVRAIYFDTMLPDPGASGLNKLEGENAFNALSEDRKLFETLYQEYNDPGFSDETPETIIDEKTYKDFPDVFETIYAGEINELLKIETEKGIVVAEIIEKNANGKPENADAIFTENAIAKILKNAQKAEKTDAYKSIDVTKYIDERSKIN